MASTSKTPRVLPLLLLQSTPIVEGGRDGHGASIYWESITDHVEYHRDEHEIRHPSVVSKGREVPLRRCAQSGHDEHRDHRERDSARRGCWVDEEASVCLGKG